MAPRYLVNCSILFTELPLLDRPAAARAAGFEAVEFWWPFDRAVPTNSAVAEFVAAVRDAGVRLAGLNFVAGDLAAGERGLVSWPGRSEEFRAGVAVAVSIGRQLDVPAFNALYGNRLPGADPAEQDALAVGNLAYAAAAAARIGATVLVEPVSGVPAYPLKTAADVLAVIDEVRAVHGCENVRLLADLYHLSVNGDDVPAMIAAHAGEVGHVQIADAPGRHQPGTGTLPIPAYLDALTAAGYDGWFSLEYVPEGPSADSFGWLPAGATQVRS
ncbi:MAG TPA: TIM barrel protein [Mycobacteriales bacterium]|jgi:hydroxypyruvate isomerase|nr:TIM barrel protein [Mycobacteriales bacterium]